MRKAATVYALAAAAFGAYAMWVAHDYLRAPVHEQWQPVLGALAELHRPGERVVFDPGWVRGYATDLGKFDAYPVARSPREAAKDTQATGAWLVSPFRAPASPRAWTERWGEPSRMEVAGFHLAAFPARSGIDRDALHYRLHEARVRVEEPGGKTWNGVWSGRMVEFPDLPAGIKEWQAVRFSAEVFNARRIAGMMFHPPVTGRLYAEWPLDAPARTLVVEGGLPDSVVVAGEERVDLVAYADGKEIGRAVFPNERGWKVHKFTLSEGATTVAVDSSSPRNHSRWLHLRVYALP
jgi:hypothetical protein